MAVLFCLGVSLLTPWTWSVPGNFWPWAYPRLGLVVLASAFGLVAAFLFLARCSPRLGATLVAITLPIGLSWAVMPAADYLPVGNKNLVFASLQPPPGYNLNQLTRLAEQIESHLRPYWQARPGSAR